MGILVLALGVFAYGLWSVKDKPTIQASPGENAPPATSFSPQVNSEGGVDTSVTPLSLDKDSDWTFEIVLDTHSGDLSEDLLTVAALADDSGKIYLPKAWEGAPPGGHHREGILVFTPVSPYPSSATLIIKNVAGIPERSFSWDLSR